MRRTLTKIERDEHIAHKQQLAHAVADRIDQGVPLEEWQQSFLRFVVNGDGAAGDYAAAMRAWAANYEPGKRRGPYPKISDVDTAMAYVLYREEGFAHTTALELLAAESKATKLGIWKAIESQVPHVCEHLGIDLSVISERKPRGRPPSSK